MAKKKKRKIGVIDFETDPFLAGRVPKPFCVEFLSDEIEQQFWGDDCVLQLVNFLDGIADPHLIYAHNGGKFDFHFLLEYIDNPALIIKSRIVECRLLQHTLRDSFAILPVPLKVYGKKEIDYAKMERPVRERHKPEILEYLHSDCRYLLDLVNAFVERFGPRMTIGGTAMRELRKRHEFRKMGADHDGYFRPFYFGGRVQTFASGILKGPWTLVDRNSMYPAAMKEKLHPVNGLYDIRQRLPDNFDMPFFAEITARNRNALPMIVERDGEKSLSFTQERGRFHACSHEIEIALKHGLIDIEEVHNVYISRDAISFGEFVDEFYERKRLAKEAEDKITELFEKLILNSAYGRTGINPHNFMDWKIHRDFGNEAALEAEGYTHESDYEVIELWAKAAEVQDNQFCDVAIAASITSAARANLLENLQLAEHPIYCDTDSIVCRKFHGETDPYILGAWDVELVRRNMAIAGKKLYALYDTVEAGVKDRPNPKDNPNGAKVSSKGGNLSLEEIIAVASGQEVYQERDAPTFSLKRQPTFVGRTFKMTA